MHECQCPNEDCPAMVNCPLPAICGREDGPPHVCVSCAGECSGSADDCPDCQ